MMIEEGFDVLYNEQLGSENHVYLTKRPDIPSPERDIELISVAGRAGVLTKDNGGLKDIVIPMEFAFEGKEEDWGEHYRLIREWLLSKGNGILKFSDDPDYFYKVKKVTITNMERGGKTAGTITADFLCAGGQYLVEGRYEHPVSGVKWNPYYLSQPVYVIYGNGECDVEVNGNVVTAEVENCLIIDTERMLSYMADQKLNNASISGNYEDLFLRNGENRIKISYGFDVKVIPNWRRG